MKLEIAAQNAKPKARNLQPRKPDTENRKPKEESVIPLDRNERIRQRRAYGWSAKKIAKIEAIPLSTVYRFIRKKKKTGPKPMKKRNDEIIRRVRNGEKQADLAREFGITRQRVHTICRKG